MANRRPNSRSIKKRKILVKVKVTPKFKWYTEETMINPKRIAKTKVSELNFDEKVFIRNKPFPYSP
jgi:hypothetical protein